jgi:hypothetical protein
VPVTADDVDLSVRLAVGALSGASSSSWDALAGGLTWTCWETAEHVADDLLFYAVQLGCGSVSGEVPLSWGARRAGGPELAIAADHAEGPAGVLRVVAACGVLLSAVVRTASPDARGHHVFGLGDAEGFAAMGVVEVLVHAYDIAGGLGVAWEPPADLCARVLGRLFPEVVVADGDPWLTLLWATGRAELPGRSRRTQWRWHSAPISDA